MAKKMYIPVVRGKKCYRVFLDDVSRLHSFIKKSRPVVPAYNESEPVQKWEEATDIEFEPLSLS